MADSPRRQVNIGGHIIDRDAQLLDLSRADCEESLYEFYRQSWPILCADPWFDSWVIRAIAEHLEAVCYGDITRLLINIPPRCGKSNLVSVAFPAWVWAQRIRGPISGPQVSFLATSYASQLTIRDSVGCRELIASKWYQDRWGDRFQLSGDQNTKSRFSNNQGGERLISSVDGTNTGEGAMCFVGNTPVNTPNGLVAISDLKVGDKVWSYNHETDSVEQSKIWCTMSSNACDKPPLVTVTFANQKSFTCTSDHRVYTSAHGYQRADKLSVGMRVLEFSHVQGVIDETVYEVKIHGPSLAEIVYDIQIEPNHNFFANGILVHNCIICDDPNAAGEAFSEKTIENTINWWKGTMSTRLNNMETGAKIVIQQRLAEDDLTGFIMDNDDDNEWTYLILPMEFEPERSYATKIGWTDPRTVAGESLWPERFNERTIKMLKKDMGPYNWPGQLQQRPEPPGGGIIKRDWWLLWPHKQFPRFDYILATVDTAYTEDEMNDPSGCIVWGIFTHAGAGRPTRYTNRRGKMVIMDEQEFVEDTPKIMMVYSWMEHLEFHELVKKVAWTAKEFQVDDVIIENKASGISVAQEVRRQFSQEKFGVQFYDPKSQNKTARLTSVVPIFADGTVFAPDRPWADQVITQVGKHPKGRRDEFVDCTSMALRHFRDLGLLARPVERLADLDAMKAYTGRVEPLYPA